MLHTDPADLSEQQPLGERGFDEGDRARLLATLDRFSKYLRARQGSPDIEATTLEALKAFPFDLPANDDQNLRLVFRLFGREDLLEHLAMVSADKYFRNKKLSVTLKAVNDLKPHVRALRRADIRMASELLERGATLEGRRELAEVCGIPPDTVLLMVKYSDLCRITGMSGKTLARAIALGYDTLDAFRASTPERAREDLDTYLSDRGERTSRMIDFGSFVTMARRLDDVWRSRASSGSPRAKPSSTWTSGPA